MLNACDIVFQIWESIYCSLVQVSCEYKRDCSSSQNKNGKYVMLTKMEMIDEKPLIFSLSFIDHHCLLVSTLKFNVLAFKRDASSSLGDDSALLSSLLELYCFGGSINPLSEWWQFLTFAYFSMWWFLTSCRKKNILLSARILDLVPWKNIILNSLLSWEVRQFKNERTLLAMVMACSLQAWWCKGMTIILMTYPGSQSG